MTEWMTILSLLGFGLALVIIEILFVPGTTLVGVVGFIFLAIGIGLSFKYFGGEVGWITLGASAVISGGVLYYAFTTNVWGKFSLKSSITSKVNEGELDGLTAGMEGIATSALRPFGKAEMNNKTFEVKTLGEYLDTGKRIRIIRIFENQIIVEPVN